MADQSDREARVALKLVRFRVLPPGRRFAWRGSVFASNRETGILAVSDPDFAEALRSRAQRDAIEELDPRPAGPREPRDRADDHVDGDLRDRVRDVDDRAGRRRDGESSQNAPAGPRTLAVAPPLPTPVSPIQPASQPARAPLAARPCPSCGVSLASSQRAACSGRCTARLSRGRATAAVAQRIAQLEAAVRALGGDPEALAAAEVGR